LCGAGYPPSNQRFIRSVHKSRLKYPLCTLDTSAETAIIPHRGCINRTDIRARSAQRSQREQCFTRRCVPVMIRLLKTAFTRSWSTPSRAFFLSIWTFTVQPAALLQRAAFRSCHGRGRALSSAHNRAIFLASFPEPSGLGIFAPPNKRCSLPKRFTRLMLPIVFSCVLF
jgi:hypothetical protein